MIAFQTEVSKTLGFLNTVYDPVLVAKLLRDKITEINKSSANASDSIIGFVQRTKGIECELAYPGDEEEEVEVSQDQKHNKPALLHDHPAGVKESDHTFLFIVVETGMQTPPLYFKAEGIEQFVEGMGYVLDADLIYKESMKYAVSTWGDLVTLMGH